jgi:hypothetical protein
MREHLKQLYNRLISWRYSIGFADYSDDIVLDKAYFPRVHWIKGVPNDRWFADPFILSVYDKEIKVLVENYSYKERKANISIICVDRNSYRLKTITPLLVLSNHLSFPAYFIQDGKLFLYPENCRSGQLKLYQFDLDTLSLERETVILKKAISDAVLAEIYGKKVIVGTLYPKDNGKDLYIFSYNDPESDPVQIISFNDNTARNAGQPFYVGEQLFRPAQCSNNRYGECLVFQKIDMTNTGQLSFNEIKRVHSPSRRFNLSFHTFNIFEKNIVVVDASGYRFRFIGRFLEALRHFTRQ